MSLRGFGRSGLGWLVLAGLTQASAEIAQVSGVQLDGHSQLGHLGDSSLLDLPPPSGRRAGAGSHGSGRGTNGKKPGVQVDIQPLLHFCQHPTGQDTHMVKIQGRRKNCDFWGVICHSD